jgi:hypothetical protein
MDGAASCKIYVHEEPPTSCLFVTDGHDGLLTAVSELFSATPRQRCLLHKQRNVLNAIPRRERGEVQAELVGIWDQPSKQEAVAQLAASTRQIWQTLSRGCEEPGPGGGGDSHLLRFSADDAPVHQDHQCHRESRKSTFVSAPIRSTSSRRRPVASRLSGPRSRTSACIKFRCEACEP